jgi:nucleoside-diphosphate-sugar epimerase
MINENIINNFERSLIKKRILVTGSSGYIGGALIRYLLKINCEILGVDKEASNSSIHELEFNLEDAVRLQLTIKNFQPDIILHTGTNSALDYHNDLTRSFEEDYASFNNLNLSLDLFSKNTKLMFYSSSYVYSGESLEKPVNEVNKLEPSHNFGIGKKFFEQYILRLHPNTTIFRLSSVFGEGEARSPNAIKNIVHDSISKGVVEVWGSGTRKMQYISIDDVVGNTLLSTDIDSGVYNLGSKDYLEINDIASVVSNFFDIKIVHNLEENEGESLAFMDTRKIQLANNFSFSPVINSLKSYLKKGNY